MAAHSQMAGAPRSLRTRGGSAPPSSLSLPKTRQWPIVTKKGRTSVVRPSSELSLQPRAPAPPPPPIAVEWPPLPPVASPPVALQLPPSPPSPPAPPSPPIAVTLPLSPPRTSSQFTQRSSLSTLAASYGQNSCA